jgi:hypothetical protein
MSTVILLFRERTTEESLDVLSVVDTSPQLGACTAVIYTDLLVRGRGEPHGLKSEYKEILPGADPAN